MAQINKIGSCVPLWSDPRNVNTLYHSSLCLEHNMPSQRKPIPDILAWRKAVQPKSLCIKKSLHTLLNCFSALSKEFSHILYFSLLKLRQKSKRVL